MPGPGDSIGGKLDALPIVGTAKPIGGVIDHTTVSGEVDAADVARAIRKAIAELEARFNAARPKHARYYWGERQGFVRYDFDWDVIRHDSVVVITASEGKPPVTSNYPERWVGAAPFYVMNIAPYDGGVMFAVRIDWEHPLNLWTDITVFDRGDPLWNRPSSYAHIQ